MKQGTITVYNEVTGQAVKAYILRQTEEVLRIAINGTPVMMHRVSPGEYEGRVAGMTLTTKRP